VFISSSFIFLIEMELSSYHIVYPPKSTDTRNEVLLGEM